MSESGETEREWRLFIEFQLQFKPDSPDRRRRRDVHLNLITVIFSSRLYNTLEVNTNASAVNEIGDRAASLFDLGNPDLNWPAPPSAKTSPARG